MINEDRSSGAGTKAGGITCDAARGPRAGSTRSSSVRAGSGKRGRRNLLDPAPVWNGFSLVEIVLTLGILMLLLFIGAGVMNTYHDWARDQLVHKDLIDLAKAIEQYEIENQARWMQTGLPANVQGVDPWGQPYHVDPARHLIWSIGPDGKNDQGSGDDVAVHWTPWSPRTLIAPTDLHVSSQSGTSVSLTWSAASYAGGISGYNLYRRVSDASYTTAPINIAPIQPSSKPDFTDAAVPGPGLYYYSMEVLGSDGSRARAANQVGVAVTGQ